MGEKNPNRSNSSNKFTTITINYTHNLLNKVDSDNHRARIFFFRFNDVLVCIFDLEFSNAHTSLSDE